MSSTQHTLTYRYMYIAMVDSDHLPYTSLPKDSACGQLRKLLGATVQVLSIVRLIDWWSTFFFCQGGVKPMLIFRREEQVAEKRLDEASCVNASTCVRVVRSL